MAQGLQHIPLRIPAEWDAKWFGDFCRDVLALADVRNAIGEGLDISGQSAEVATLAVSADIQALLEQPFVLAQPSGFLENERTLAGEADVIQILDGGPDANITVALIDGGLPLGKLKALTDYGVLGNPVDGGGAVQNLVPSGDKAVLHVNGTSIEFDLIDSTFISDFEEAVQDVMGSTLTDSTGVDWVYDDLTGTILANLNFANPTASIGLTAVNGTAATPMRSDAAPALDQSIAPTWTADHRWIDNEEVQLGTGGDLRLFHNGTDSFIRNDTGELQLMAGATAAVRISAAGNIGVLTAPLAGINAFTVEGSARFQCSASGQGGQIEMIGGGAAINRFRYQNADSSAPRFAIRDDQAGVDRLIIMETTGNIRIPGDNQELQIGVGEDLRLYHDGTNSFVRNNAGALRFLAGANEGFRLSSDRALQLVDGITAPATATGFASIYVDTADGDLKVKFGDGTVKTIATDT